MRFEDNKEPRPAIWSEGRQNPPFQLRAFARASLIYARDGLSGLLQRCSASADDASNVVATGRWRVPESRLGRSGRFLPSYRTLAATVRGAAGLLSRAARVVLPEMAEAPTSLFTATPKPAEARLLAPIVLTPAATATAGDEDRDLDAIRALMATSADQPRRSDGPQHPVPTATQAATAVVGTNWRREWLAGTVSLLLGYGLLLVSLPYGVVIAVMAHLNGEDLRKLDA